MNRNQNLENRRLEYRLKKDVRWKDVGLKTLLFRAISTIRIQRIDGQSIDRQKIDFGGKRLYSLLILHFQFFSFNFSLSTFHLCLDFLTVSLGQVHQSEYIQVKSLLVRIINHQCPIKTLQNFGVSCIIRVLNLLMKLQLAIVLCIESSK